MLHNMYNVNDSGNGVSYARKCNFFKFINWLPFY